MDGECIMSVTHKRITIPHNGPIYPKAGAMGPIISKHVETIETIALLVQGGYPVVEHLNDGKTVDLTLTNFRQDFNVQTEVTLMDKPQPLEPVLNDEVVDEPVEKVEKDVQHEPKAQNNKKNKDRNNNKPVQDPTQSK